MGVIRVTAADIKRTSEQLKSFDQNFKSQVEKLNSSEGSLNSMWEGDAKNAFHAAFQSDREYMNQFYNLIQKYCQALDNIAVEYENAEARNTDTATRRSF